MEPPAASGKQLSDIDDGEDSASNLQSDQEDEIKEGSGQASQHSATSAQQLCRFYSQGRRCYYGKKCRFLHQKAAPSEAVKDHDKRPDIDPEHIDKDSNGNAPSTVNIEAHQHSDTCSSSEKNEHKLPSNARPPSAQQQRATRPCRYFMSGFCMMEDRCRFFHPQQFPQLDVIQPARNVERSNARAKAPVSRPPTVQEQVKLADLNEEMTKKLRATEISQLMKRFPKDKLIVQEREDGQFTYYRVTVEATDPDWPYDLKCMDVMVSFPKDYPKETFTIDVPLDQDLPAVMGRHVQLTSLEWLQAKHATNLLMGKVELLFRPYLRWLDRSLERLFTEGARQLKKDIELERAGIQFVPYEQLQEAVCKNAVAGDPGDPGASSPEDSSVMCSKEEEAAENVTEGEVARKQVDPGSDDEAGSRPVENIKSNELRKGTEVKLLSLKLGEGTATVVATQITVSLQCNRCKVTSDLTLSGRLTCTAQCEKCGAGISAAFRPSMLHHYSDVLGYLDLTAAVPVDLILQDCRFTVGCLSCNQEDTLQHLSYGQNKETNCQHCHNKLCIFVEATRFQYIQPKTLNQTGQSDVHRQRYIRDPAVQSGKPLPQKGACKHYKQSHRWLRFPCCGRAYPCDACHDEDQDHLMELATRMICGYCAKEQPYSNGKPCVSCGGMMTKGAYTSHWEGGLGCRNKAKMSRNDHQKYSNTCKTVSRKAQSAKK